MLIRKSIIHLFVLCVFALSSLAQANIPENILSYLKITNTVINKIVLQVPDIAESGAVVPVTIQQIILDDSNVYVESVYIFNGVRKDPVAHFKLGQTAMPEGISTRVRLAKTTTVYALAVLSDGRVLSAQHQVKVTVGGCGGGYIGSGTYQRGFSPYSLASPAHYNGGVQNTEKYAVTNDNPLKLVMDEPVSTFSIDVDTGAYSNVRRFVMKEGQLPVSDAVRVEELVNYFAYDYPVPATSETPFTVTTEMATTPWNANTKLLHIGLKGYEVPATTLPPANLVFLIDVSGSMHSPDKLGLLKSSLRMLTNRMRPVDRVSMVVYAGASGVVLEPTSGSERHKILAALDALAAGGSTNGEAGIQLAYAKARQAYIPGGINRVIIATDGDFNVGTVNHEALIDLVKRQRATGISITALGYGRGNYNEHLMEQIADHGDGNYAYIDSLQEARKTLVEEMASTLFTIAKDVKIQVEFNPASVSEYRLIGYENRMLKREDFNNDKVDAGDIGAGHTVTAIYEVTLKGSAGQRVEPLRYQSSDIDTGYSGELAQVKLRYKDKDGGPSKLIRQVINTSDIRPSQQVTSENFRFAAAVAAYGQLLRGGKYTQDFSYADVRQLATTAMGDDSHGNRGDFIKMVNLTQALQPVKATSVQDSNNEG